MNNHIGVPISILNINNKHEIAVIEMGANHLGEIEFLCSIAQPNYGVITNIGSAHLDGFINLEGVIKMSYMNLLKGKMDTSLLIIKIRY